MCGIAAWIDWGGRAKVAEVERMTAPIRHRGPDGAGVVASGGVTLGHRRLSIIDLSEQGAQPMQRGDLTVTYNGEIYNYLELRRELIARRHHFASESDTEVLLAAYEEWGPECVTHFNGMWSFALHDRRSDAVFCSRDRFGEKPLLYCTNHDSLIMGSEAKQFHIVGRGREPDFDSVREFLVIGRKASVEATYFRGIRALPPATNMIVSLKNRSMSFAKYYTPGESRRYSGLDEDDLLSQLDAQLRRSINLRLRSDVPVGMLLSGGIDSSLIAAYAGPAYLEATGRPLVAITAASGDAHNDESKYASETASKAQAAWEPVEVTHSITRESWSKATAIIEQPLGSSSHVMQMRVMQRAAQAGLTVLLDGQGADESWMGYGRYAATAVNDLPWSRRPGFARRSADRSGLGLPRWLAQWAYFQSPSLARIRTSRRLSSIGYAVDRDWYQSRFTETFGRRASSVQEMQALELEGEQLSSLLRYADLTSMEYSVEDRLPFLDHHIVELALTMPTPLLFREGWSKWPLRNNLARFVPASIAWRKRKIGFEAPRSSFDPRDAGSLALIEGSGVLRELGLKSAFLREASQVIMWRLFAVAMWEREVLVRDAGA